VNTEPAKLERYAGVRVLVFGATGFIGAWLARRLLQIGSQLTVAARSANAAARLHSWSGGEVPFMTCDVCNDECVRETVSRVRPHITFNLAGYGVDRTERDEAQAQRVNARFVGVLCEAVAESRDPGWTGAALVHAGTQLEYGPVRGELSEGLVPGPSTLYGKSKLEGTERLQLCAEAHGLPAFTARLFNVYGPGERSGRLLPLLMEAAAKGQALPLTEGEQKADFVYVEDVAEGLLRIGLARGSPGEVVNLATGKLTSVRAFAERAARLLGLPQDLLRFGALPQRAETLRYNAVSTARLRRLTGWTPPAEIDDGIRRTIERHGWAYARE
jgi:nucleoside-diphosphate-sugar epimerase